TGLHIRRLLCAAGVPEDCFQCVLGGAAAGQMLLELPLDGYFFTGSFKTGKYVAGRVAEKLVPCQLELGGKNPRYVADDVRNIDAAAEAALEGVVYNTGQSCCAVERMYVHRKIYDAFVSSFVTQAKKLSYGDPLDPATSIGPLARKAQQEFLRAQVE